MKSMPYGLLALLGGLALALMSLPALAEPGPGPIIPDHCCVIGFAGEPPSSVHCDTSDCKRHGCKHPIGGGVDDVPGWTPGRCSDVEPDTCQVFTDCVKKTVVLYDCTSEECLYLPGIMGQECHWDAGLSATVLVTDCVGVVCQ